MARVVQLSDSFDRPNDATQYADNDLVANSGTAGSVTPLYFNLGANGSHIVAIRIEKTDSDTTAADFSINFYGASPTPANGDNGAISTDVSDKIAVVDVGAMVAGTDDDYVILNMGDTGFLSGLFTNFDNVYALLECNSTYTPLANETFTVYLTVIKEL